MQKFFAAHTKLTENLKFYLSLVLSYNTYIKRTKRELERKHEQNKHVHKTSKTVIAGALGVSVLLSVPSSLHAETGKQTESNVQGNGAGKESTPNINPPKTDTPKQESQKENPQKEQPKADTSKEANQTKPNQ